MCNCINVQGWKVPERLLAETLQFRPSAAEGPELNPVEVSRQRLLELEAAIERRYLKPPLAGGRIATMRSVQTLG